MAIGSRLLLWVPRTLGVFMALFLGAFALDVFDEPLDFWPTLAAFAIHLLPAAVVVAALAVAWRRSGVGGLLFMLAGFAYAGIARGHLSWILVISGPLFLIGALFMLASFWKGAPSRA